MDERKPRILLIEDEPNQMLLYREELEEEGYEIVEADSDKKAIQEAERLRKEGKALDLIITDLSSLGDRTETIGRILSCNNRLPVIINSAYASCKDNFLSWSADAYVIKSSDLTELKEAVRKVLDRGRRK